MLNKIKIRSIKNILFRGNDSYLSNIPLTVSIHRAVTENRISNVITFNFLLNPLFMDVVQKNQQTGFTTPRPFLFINLKWRPKFQISRLLIRDSDWLNFIKEKDKFYYFLVLHIVEERG